MAKKRALDVDEGEDKEAIIVLSYLHKQNRPYNLNDIFNNLGGKIGKTSLTKVLANLVKNGDVKEKVYNKQSIYVPVQSKETSLTKKETEDKNKEIAQLRKDILDLQKKIKELQSKYAAVRNTPSIKDLEQKYQSLTNENIDLQKKLKQESNKKGSQDKITLEDQNKAEEELTKMVQMWKKRRSLFKEIWGVLTESMEKNTDTLKAQLGIEDDKDAGVDIDKALECI